jgi:alpha-tubulin suppressor-like RCC1 family protein
MAGVRLRSVAAGFLHSLALGCDGKVYSWGGNTCGQLGHGSTDIESSPVLVQGLEGVRGIATSRARSLAVTQSGAVLTWGRAFLPEAGDEDTEDLDEEDLEGTEHLVRPIIVVGFHGVLVRQVCAEEGVVFAIGQGGELFSWGRGGRGLLGHGDRENQPSPKRVEALRGVSMSTVSVGRCHALALTEDGLVYACGENEGRALLGNPDVERELLPKPVEALRGVRVGSIAAAGHRSYAAADTGELWAWGAVADHSSAVPLGHNELRDCPLPKPIESLRGIKVDAVAAGGDHTLALADDGSVYAWGSRIAQAEEALGLVISTRDAAWPQRIPALRVGL